MCDPDVYGFLYPTLKPFGFNLQYFGVIHRYAVIWVGRYNLPSVWTNILNQSAPGPGPRISNSNQSLQDDTNAI